MYLLGMNVFAINWKCCLFKEEDIWDKSGKEDENYIHFPKSMNVKELKLGLIIFLHIYEEADTSYNRYIFICKIHKHI